MMAASDVAVEQTRVNPSYISCARDLPYQLTIINMSATQRVQQHPAFVQAQTKASHYVGQLDKEVCISAEYSV